MFRLVLRQHFSDRHVDSKLACDGVGCALRVPGQHHDAHTRLLQRCDRVRRALFDRVRDRRNRDGHTIDGEEHDGLGFSTQHVCAGVKLFSLDPALLQEGAAADQNAPAIHARLDAESVQHLEIRGRREGESSLLRLLNDGVRDRMLRGLLDGGKQQERVVARDPIGFELGQRRPPERQGAGLVHDEGVDVPHALDRFRATEEDACARTFAHRNGHRDRRGEPHRARARDDEHRDRIQQRVGDRRRRPEQPPDPTGDDRDGDDHFHEARGDHIRELLYRCARALRFTDHVHDAREQGVGADALRTHDERAVAIDRGTGHLVPGGFRDGHGFTRHHGFVDAAGAIEHSTVHGNLLAGLDPQAVTHVNAR